MSTEKYELGAMSVDELWSLHEEISAALLARILDQKQELEKRLAKLNHGIFPLEEFSLPETAKSAKIRRKYPKVVPKYRDPESSQTWSGRGKLPRWLTVAMQSGHSMEEYKIDEARVEKLGRSGASASPNGRR